MRWSLHTPFPNRSCLFRNLVSVFIEVVLRLQKITPIPRLSLSDIKVVSASTPLIFEHSFIQESAFLQKGGLCVIVASPQVFILSQDWSTFWAFFDVKVVSASTSLILLSIHPIQSLSISSERWFLRHRLFTSSIFPSQDWITFSDFLSPRWSLRLHLSIFLVIIQSQNWVSST